MTTFNIINRINEAAKSAKLLGAFALMFLVAGVMIAAPAASANSSVRYGKFTITTVDAVNSEAVALASVEVVNSNGIVVAKGQTDKSGWYSTYLSQGTYKVNVFAADYQQYTSKFDVKVGGSTQVSASLQRLNSDPISDPSPVAWGKLSVFATHSTNDVGIAGAAVLVFNQYGEVAAKGETDQSGYFIVALPAGEYKVSVKAEGYQEANQAVQVIADQVAQVTADLQAETVATSDDTGSTPPPTK